MSANTKEKFPSTFTVDFSSTTRLSENEYRQNPSGLVGARGAQDGEKEYDPYEHRVIEHPNTFSGALIHLLKSSLGTGILAIPSAFKNSGIVPGVIGTILTGIVCTHTIHQLVSASQEICKKAKVSKLGFSETAEEVFKHGPKKVQRFSGFAKNFVDIALLLTYYAGNAVYVVFICELIQQLVLYYHEETSDWAVQYFMLMLLVPLVICSQVRELKHLVPFSFVANATMIVAFGITLYYIFAGLGDIKVTNDSLFKDVSGFPRFFSTVLFAMEGIGTMLPIENTMVKQQFIGCPGVLNIAMASVTALYTVMGVFGYLRYGERVGSNIIGNLPEGEIAAQIAKGCISVAVFFTFMLQFYVPVDITWRKISPKIPQRYHNLSQIIMRTLLVILVTGIGAAVPKLDVIIDLVGSIFFSTLGLFIPAVIDTVLRSTDGDFGLCKWKLWKNLLIIVIALFALFSGSYFAILKLIEEP